MDNRINQTIKKYIDSVVLLQPGLVSAFLFGSYALNKQGGYSDIDIALVFDTLSDKDKFDIQVQLMILASKIDNRIEPHPISNQDMNSMNPFAMEIKRTEIVLDIGKS